jgi:hypothetical protein
VYLEGAPYPVEFLPVVNGLGHFEKQKDGSIGHENIY